MKNKSLVSPSFVKQIAKKLKKEKSLSQSQALDEASRHYGFSNYKNYINTLEINRKRLASIKKVILRNISLENNMAKKVKLAVSFIQEFQVPFHDLLDILKLFQRSEKDLQFVCGKSNVQDEIQIYLLNDFLTIEGQLEIESYYEYYRAKNLSLKDITYEIDGDMLCVDGMYDLTIEFDYEIPDDYKGFPHFEDRSLLGSFEITIDRNKKITLDHSDIGAERGIITEDELQDYYKRFPDEKQENTNSGIEDDSYDHVECCLLEGKPLTGKTLELALDLVDVIGDDEFSRFVRNIGVKIKAGQLLDKYECHIMVDVLLMHARLGA